MKAEELELGDWVISDGEPHKVCVLRRFPEDHTIGCLGKYGEFFDTINKITPIKLTPEILEKNGWWLDFWWEHKEHPFFLVKYADGSWANGKFGVMFEPDDGDPAFLVGSVHELQHALRLCGLTELANNFKVD